MYCPGYQIGGGGFILLSHLRTRGSDHQGSANACSNMAIDPDLGIDISQPGCKCTRQLSKPWIPNIAQKDHGHRDKVLQVL
jgi:hypothetical protein